MAITIHQSPTENYFVPVNNPIQYLASSTNTAEANFKLSCKIVVGSTEVKELLYDVIPSTAFVVAEIQGLIDSYALDNRSYVLNQSTGIVSIAPAAMALQVTGVTRAVFQEYYSNPASSAPTYQGSQASGDVFYLWNGAFKYREWQANDWYDYSIIQDGVNEQRNAKMLSSFKHYVENASFNNTSTAQYPNALTKSLRFKKITPTQFNAIAYQAIGTNNLATHDLLHTFRFYDSDLAANTSPNPEYVQSVSSALNIKSRFTQTFNISVFGSANSSSMWNNVQNTVLLTSSNTSYVAHFVLMATNALGVVRPATAVYLYEIDWNACSKYDNYEIHWLNHLGGWDNWVFDKKSNIQVDVQREFYTQPKTWRIESNAIVHDEYARKKTQFSTILSERYTVNSDILKDWEYEGLTDLLQSPLVYWRHPDYGFIAINILEQSSYPIKTQLNDKAYNLSFVFEVSNNDKLQGL